MLNILIFGGCCPTGNACLDCCLHLLYRLNDSYIVFRGTEEEAASAHLKGTLVLCLTEPISIKHLKLRLTGMSRVW